MAAGAMWAPVPGYVQPIQYLTVSRWTAHLEDSEDGRGFRADQRDILQSENPAWSSECEGGAAVEHEEADI